MGKISGHNVIDLTKLKPRVVSECFLSKNQNVPSVNKDIPSSESLIDSVLDKFNTCPSSGINELISKYMQNLVKPVPKHEIKTIGIIYQTIAIGGVETFIVNICKMFLEMGYKVVLLTNSIHESITIPDCVEIEHIEKFIWDNVDVIRTRMRQVSSAILKHKIDLVFSQEYWQTVSLYDFLAANSLGCYFMMCFHNNPCFLFKERYGRTNFEYTFNCFKYFDKVIALSREHVRLLEEFGVDATYIPNVVDSELIEVANQPREGFNDEIAWIGRFCEQKNPIEAVHVFNEMCKCSNSQKIKLDMIGSVESQKTYNDVVKLVQDLGLADKVVFYGEKTNQEVVQCMKRARVLLYTSKFDGYPYLIAEAMACGIPIVANEQGDLELFKCCPSIVQCETPIQMQQELLRTYNLPNDDLMQVAHELKKSFLGIYGNNGIQKTYVNLFKTFGGQGKKSKQATIFGRMLYRYILQGLKEK